MTRNTPYLGRHPVQETRTTSVNNGVVKVMYESLCQEGGGGTPVG